MLIDTSAWIEFFKNPESQIALFIDQYLDTSLAVYICPTIYQEILQGFTIDKEYKEALNTFRTFEMLLFADQVKATVDAAGIYRNCRKKGFTIRKPNDCLIALYALANNIEILHWDKDFNAIAQVYRLRINPNSKL